MKYGNGFSYLRFDNDTITFIETFLLNDLFNFDSGNSNRTTILNLLRSRLFVSKLNILGELAYSCLHDGIGTIIELGEYTIIGPVLHVEDVSSCGCHEKIRFSVDDELTFSEFLPKPKYRVVVKIPMPETHSREAAVRLLKDSISDKNNEIFSKIELNSFYCGLTRYRVIYSRSSDVLIAQPNNPNEWRPVSLYSQPTPGILVAEPNCRIMGLIKTTNNFVLLTAWEQFLRQFDVYDRSAFYTIIALY